MAISGQGVAGLGGGDEFGREAVLVYRDDVEAGSAVAQGQPGGAGGVIRYAPVLAEAGAVQVPGEDGVHPVLRELVKVELPVGGLEIEVILRFIHGLLDYGAVREDEEETRPLVGGEGPEQPGTVLPFLLDAPVLQEAGVHPDEGAAAIAEAEVVVAVTVEVVLQVALLAGLQVVVAGDVPHGDILVNLRDQAAVRLPLLLVETVVDHVSRDDDEGRADAVDRLDRLGQQPHALRHRVLLLESQLGIRDLDEEERLLRPGGQQGEREEEC